jgi:3-oxoacyl-[acyl-carrier protein] reductase
MNLDLAGKCAIVGGASQGIGYGIAHLLASEGARVAITARREKDLRASAERMAMETGAEILPVQADCRQAADCERVVNTVADAFGHIGILINNDGAPPLGDLATFDDVAWQKAIEQNFMYVARMCRGVLPHMQKAGGSIVNVTAISAIQPIPRFGLSVASWGAVIGYAKTLALEAARFGINVNTVCPGYVDTQRLEKVFSAGEKPAQEVRRALEQEVPIGRIGTVGDIANLVALLVSPRGSYITGTVIPVDGGLFRAVR